MKLIHAIILECLLLLTATITQAQSPVTYDDFEGSGLVTWNYFEDAGKPGTVEFDVPNPNKSGINLSDNVAVFTKTATSSQWMNAFIDVPKSLDLSVVSTFTLMVYSSNLQQVKLKLQPGDDFANAVERTANITVANTWQLLTFDFTSVKSRTDFNKINLHFNDGTAADGVYYFDMLSGPNQVSSFFISDDGEIKRNNENGEIISVDLYFDQFVPSLNSSNWSFQNLPEGISISQINRISNRKAELVLSGNATSNYSKSISDFTVTISHEELSILSAGDILANTGVLFDASYWKLIWSDEFDVDGAPNSDYWTHEIWNPGQVNNELQYYTASLENSRIEDGNLLIQAIKKGDNWYSARLQSRNKVDFLYGTIEARLKVPPGRGTWPAFWLMPTESVYGGWPHSGEYDIMEYVGYQPNRVYSTTHTGAHFGENGIGSSYDNNTVEEEFHVYKMNWTPDSMVTYFDDIQFFKYLNPGNGNTEEWPYDQKFYPILNLAIGGNWGGAQGVDPTLDTCNYYIDYVRILKNMEDMFISGPDEVYAYEKNLSFNIENLDGIDYTWLPSDKYTVTSGTDTNEITINWGCSTDTLRAEILVDGTELYTITKIITIKPFEIIGDIWIDEQATNQLYTTQDAEEATFTWSASEGITIVSGQGNDSIYADFAQEGSIYLATETACGTQYDTLVVRFGDGQFPYPNELEPHAIPGKIVAGYFDIGGESVAYHDFDVANQGGVLRPDEGIDLEQKDGSYTLGWTRTGEWMEYTVDVAETGLYDLKIRAGGEQNGRIRILQNEVEVLETTTIAGSGSWDSFKNVFIDSVSLVQGVSILKVEFVQGGCNLGDMTFSVPSAIDETELTEKLLIYPNPVKDFLSVQLNNDKVINEPVTIKIFNLHGQLILTNLLQLNEDNSCEIDLSTLPQGIYLISIIDPVGNNNAHFIKE